MVNKKRITAKQHALHGNPSKIVGFDDILQATPEPVQISPDVPESIRRNPDALEMWTIIEIELMARSEYVKTYAGLIEGACISFARWRQANRVIESFESVSDVGSNFLVAGENLLIGINPYLKISRDAFKDYITAMKEMALTPISATQKGFNSVKKENNDDIMELLKPR